MEINHALISFNLKKLKLKNNCNASVWYVSVVCSRNRYVGLSIKRHKKPRKNAPSWVSVVYRPNQSTGLNVTV